MIRLEFLLIGVTSASRKFPEYVTRSFGIFLEALWQPIDTIVYGVCEVMMLFLCSSEFVGSEIDKLKILGTTTMLGILSQRTYATGSSRIKRTRLQTDCL